MCGIVGINGIEIAEKLRIMLLSIENRGHDGSGIFVDDKVFYGKVDNINIPKGSFGLGHNLLSIVGDEALQPIIRDNLVLVCNGEIYNFKELKKQFNFQFNTDSDCEVILCLIERFYDDDLKHAVNEAVKCLDGDYAFAVYDGKDYTAIRDIVGVKPLYYGKDKEQTTFAFASERKALWNIGISSVSPLKPDSMIYNDDIIKLDNDILGRINLKSKKSFTFEDLKQQLKENIIISVKKRVAGLDKVGILFSAGIDSTILTKVCQILKKEIILYCVGSEDSIDIKFARETARSMKLPLKTRIIDIDDVDRYLPRVLDAIEEFNIMKLGVGMPAYIAAEMAHADGLKVMLSGQGADELFGGYHRYLKLYEEMGEDTQKSLNEDIMNLYHVNLQRDDAVTMAHGIELRVPYLDLDIINTAINIPIKYKIKGKNDKLRKCILREVGADLGLPDEIVNRPKKAAQYGSGIHKMLKKVLKEDKYKNLSQEYSSH